MKNILILISALSISQLHGMVPKKMLVEHFTNTYCSVCASRNPGFRTNLNTQNNYVYISYHPSSPYPSCIFNKANTYANDLRCKFYGMYGSTPRLAINGIAIPASANYNSSALFSPYNNQESAFEVHIRQLKIGNEIRIRLSIIKKDTSSVGGNGMLYLAIDEDSINYDAPNGEKQHFSVFRKALTAASGQSIELPMNTDDSLVYNFSTLMENGWDIKHIQTTAILSDADNKYLQAEQSKAADSDPALELNEIELTDIKVFPNPFTHSVKIIRHDPAVKFDWKMTDIYGRTILYMDDSNSEMIEMNEMPAGIYFLTISVAENKRTFRLVKKDD